MPTFETILFDYFNNIKNFIRAQPLFLGGVTGSGGGTGGPPGGFVGYLPQVRVAYDLSELATNYTPVSGSLVDNLNHIRYRLSAVESGGVSGGISIEEDGVLVASGITVINFVGGVSVTETIPGEVTVVVSGGAGSSQVFGEDIAGVGTSFTTTYVFADGTLCVYYNGLRQRKIYYSEGMDNQSFTTTFTVASGDELFVDYTLN